MTSVTLLTSNQNDSALSMYSDSSKSLPPSPKNPLLIVILFKSYKILLWQAAVKPKGLFAYVQDYFINMEVPFLHVFQVKLYLRNMY